MDGADSGNGGVVAPQAPRHDGPPSTTNDQVHTTLERKKTSTMLHEIEIIKFSNLKKKKNQKVTWRVNISPLSGGYGLIQFIRRDVCVLWMGIEVEVIISYPRE